MNKYEQLFSELLLLTKNDDLRWKQLKKHQNAELIFNPQLVWRQYSSELERGGNIFTVILVEKKCEDPEMDFAYEKYIPELLIIDDGELIATLNDSVIEKRDMINLASLVETKSDKARKLFGN